MTNEHYLINEVFDRLDEWRNFPAFLLQRRTDILFGIYLPCIIEKKFGIKPDHIIPEFPVSAGTVFDADLTHSTDPLKIDYLAVNENRKEVYLIELITDVNTVLPLQHNYIGEAKKHNIPDLVDGVIAIRHASMIKKKYDNLLSKLNEMGWVDNTLLKNTSNHYTVKVVCIQPQNVKGNNEIITFADIVEYLSDKEDFFTRRFCESLTHWTNNPNE